MNEHLLTRKQAAAQLGISECTVSRCVKRGAPVHRWGSTGRHYLINVPTFIEWMESQNAREIKEAAERKCIDLTVEQMAARRLQTMRKLRSRSTGS